MSPDGLRPAIHVLAGPNGAGKSSVGGRSLRAKGGMHFDPDASTRTIRTAMPELSDEQANSLSWRQMVRQLEVAIRDRRGFTFETTLGGNTITRMLADAAPEMDVRMWYVQLASPEHHAERVRARVARGGHDIPIEKIRARYDSSRLHLIQLLPVLAELYLYDNTEPHENEGGAIAEPRLVLHVRRRRIEHCAPLPEVPQWAKAIVMAAMEIDAAHH